MGSSDGISFPFLEWQGNDWPLSKNLALALAQAQAVECNLLKPRNVDCQSGHPTYLNHLNTRFLLAESWITIFPFKDVYEENRWQGETEDIKD
ncbi:hypothetical protein PROFUN_15755 [Planoprotostelium fungivorum]|uniref:Uncharacterized protein n=1 Tax=Planoprotostelium fungivorum TaxID=1890364 RepID=A0A2P6MUM2_9EUKA|nr:hypothetical protein PROFUN_15755 [Planoprotostelium fungivorum]